MSHHRGGGRGGGAAIRDLHAEFGEGEGEGDDDGGGASAAVTKSQPALLPSGGAPRVRPASAAPRLAPPPQQQQQRPASAARQQRRGSVPIRLQVPPRMELSSSAERDLLARSDRPWLHLPKSQPSRSPMLAKARPVPSRGSAQGSALLSASASAPALNLRAAPAGGGVRQQKAARAPAVSAVVAPAAALPHREQALENEALLVTGLPVPRGLDDLSERVTKQQLELYRQQQHELGLAGDAGREYLD